MARSFSIRGKTVGLSHEEKKLKFIQNLLNSKPIPMKKSKTILLDEKAEIENDGFES